MVQNHKRLAGEKSSTHWLWLCVKPLTQAECYDFRQGPANNTRCGIVRAAMKAMGSEDCLHLAVFTPEVCTDDTFQILDKRRQCKIPMKTKERGHFILGLAVSLKGQGHEIRLVCELYLVLVHICGN
jgi:hypothetical protein